MLRSLAIALVTNERIMTTVPKAKELRKLSDRLVTLGKKGDLAARRRAAAILNSKEATKKLFDQLSPRFSTRNGGYTRIVKAGWRPGDGAPMCFIEFIPEEGKPKGADRAVKKLAKRAKEKAAEVEERESPKSP